MSVLRSCVTSLALLVLASFPFAAPVQTQTSAAQQDQQQYQQQFQQPAQQQDQRSPEVSVQSAPPPAPIDAYDQPPCPGDGYAWMPGYWGWMSNAWSWMPGIWAYPPYIGALWTPGYWGMSVGYYGGMFYGGGYWGRGFYGRGWDRGHYYNDRGEHGPGGLNGRQFHSAGHMQSTTGREAMHESVARANNYSSIRGGGMQSGNHAAFNSSAEDRSYGNSMAREFGGTSARSFNQARGFSGGAFAGQRSYSNSYSSRGGFSGGGGRR